jgi:hypothetical protein
MKRLIAVCVCLLLPLFSASVFGQKSGDQNEVKLKPDIVITEARILPPTATPGETYEVTLQVTVANTVMGTATGPFKVLAEWTENPTAGFNRLGEAGVTTLEYSAAAAHAPTKVLLFPITVHRGHNYKFRITADSSSMVVELNEGNNISAAAYMAR